MKTTAQRPTEYHQTDTQRLRELANTLALSEPDVAELRELAARLGITIRMQRIDLADSGRVTEYTIG